VTDHELERHISDLGRLIEKAYAEGDRAAAVAWSKARTEAIKARSPQQIAAMEAELGLGECQFTVQGEADRKKLEVSRA